MDERPFLLSYHSGRDSIDQAALINPEDNLPFPHVIETIRNSFVGILSDLGPNSDDTTLAAYASKLRLTWHRPLANGKTHPSRLPSVSAFNSLWTYALKHPDFEIEIFASAPFYDIPSTHPPDLHDMPLRGSTPAPAPSPTPQSKPAPAPPATAQTEPAGTPHGFHSASSIDSPAAFVPETAHATNDGPPTFVPDTSASVPAADDSPPLWSRTPTDVTDDLEDPDTDDAPLPRKSTRSNYQATYGNSHGFHWTLPNGTMIVSTPDQKSFMKNFPKLLSEEHHDIRLWYEGLTSFAAPHGFLIPPSALIDSDCPLGFDWSSVPSGMQVQQQKWSVLIATALMQTGTLPARSSLIDIVSASNNDGYAALYSILQNVHPKLSLRPGTLTASTPRQKHNESILKFSQRCLDFFNLEDGEQRPRSRKDRLDFLVCNSLHSDWLAQKVDEDWKHQKKRWKFTPQLVGTTLTNYLALPGAPKPVIKKSFWGNKTPYGDRNSPSYGHGNRDSHRETRNVSFTDDADPDADLDSTVDFLVNQLASKKSTDTSDSTSAAPCTICNRHPDTTKCHRLQEHLAMSDYIAKHPDQLELLKSRVKQRFQGPPRQFQGPRPPNPRHVRQVHTGTDDPDDFHDAQDTVDAQDIPDVSLDPDFQ